MTEPENKAIPYGSRFNGVKFREVRRRSRYKGRRITLALLSENISRWEGVAVGMMEISRWERGLYVPRFDELMAAVSQLRCTIRDVLDVPLRAPVSRDQVERDHAARRSVK